MISGFVASTQGKEIAGKIVVVAKMRHSQRMNDPLVNIWIIAQQLSSRKIFWKLLTVKQQSGMQDLATCIQSKFHKYNNELLKCVERLCLPCNISEDVLEKNRQYFHRRQPSVKGTSSSLSQKSLYGLALGVLNSFQFDFFTFGNCHGRLIRLKKRPPHSSIRYEFPLLLPKSI